MVLVIFEHSYHSVNQNLVPPALDSVIWLTTGLAAVAFVAISGMVCSYFLSTRPSWKRVYQRYAKRAVFMLLAVHPVINLSTYLSRAVLASNMPGQGSPWAWLALNIPITDTIALCLLVSPPIVVRLGAVARIWGITLLLVLSFLATILLRPESLAGSYVQEALFGVVGRPRLFWFPVVPWLAIFLAGSLAGDGLARVVKGTLDDAALMRRLNRVGLGLASISVVAVVAYRVLNASLAGMVPPGVLSALHPTRTTTLLPGYLSVLVLLFVRFRKDLDLSGTGGRVAWLLSILGRTSLFTYVTQFFVVKNVPVLLGFKGRIGLPGFLVLFVSGLGVMLALSYWYGRLRGWIVKGDFEAFSVARAG